MLESWQQNVGFVVAVEAWAGMDFGRAFEKKIFFFKKKKKFILLFYFSFSLLIVKLNDKLKWTDDFIFLN